MTSKWHEDFFTQQAKKEGYVARSIYKLQELDEKFHLFWPQVSTVLDVWCAPGSRLQYASWKLKAKNGTWKIIGVDLKKVEIDLPDVVTYLQDATDQEGMQRLFDQHQIKQFDLILSDMAPDTTSNANLDALKSIDLIERVMRIVDAYLMPAGQFVFKVFMWPWFDQFVSTLKQQRWPAHIRLFKPKSSRKASKETFIVKRGC